MKFLWCHCFTKSFIIGYHVLTKLITTMIWSQQPVWMLQLGWKPFKWCLHRPENITCCCYCQRWQFEKMGEFLLKLHRSAKSLDPHCMCVQTFRIPLLPQVNTNSQDESSLDPHRRLSLHRDCRRSLAPYPACLAQDLEPALQIQVSML